MRVLYLHLMLLGFVSLGLVASARAVWGEPATEGSAWFYSAVGLVLLSLVPLSQLWPAGWGGRWAFVLAAWVAPLPVLAATLMLELVASVASDLPDQKWKLR